MTRILTLSLILVIGCNSNYSHEQEEVSTQESASNELIVTENSNQDNLAVNDPMIQQELPQLKKLAQQLSKDYQEILTLEDMITYMVIEEKGAYIKMYQEVLDKMDYMTDDFKKELIQEIRNSQAQDNQENLKPLTDPLFKQGMPSKKLFF